jgi:hypothetical protein
MGEDENDPSWVDKFYTPMNEKYAGKSAPDMFGVTIHANIISMILEEAYINQMPELLNIIIGVVICFLNVWYFYYLHRNKSQYYDLLTKTIQFVETVIILFFVVLVFDKLHYKMDLSAGITTLLLSGDMLEIYSGLTKTLLVKNRKNIVSLPD